MLSMFLGESFHSSKTPRQNTLVCYTNFSSCSCHGNIKGRDNYVICTGRKMRLETNVKCYAQNSVAAVEIK